jgi:hypothetical protein
MILKERKNTLSSKLCVGGQLTALPACQPFGGANPKSAIAGGKETSDVATGQMPTIGRLPWGGPHTIEAKQAEFRAQPEIPVLRLSNCDDRTFGKALANCPRRVRVLVDCKRRV